MKIIFALIYPFLIINICSGQGLNDWNLNFEEWDSAVLYENEIIDDVILDRDGMVPLHWFCNNSNIIACSGYSQTTDSENGEYAFVLSGFYQHEYMSISLGNSPTSGMPIEYKPESLKGSYKAILLGTTCDSLRAYVDLYLTKYNFQEQLRDTIGEGHLILEETDNAYIDFIVDIIYNKEEINPDSISLMLSKRRFGFPLNINECYECGHVFFDDFSLPAISLSINENDRPLNEFECYPNPATDHVMIKNISTQPKVIQVFDALGSIIFMEIIEANSEIVLQTQHLPTSMIFVADGWTTKRIIITN